MSKESNNGDLNNHPVYGMVNSDGGAKESAKQAVAGLVAGAVSTIFTHPLDVIKTRLQCMIYPSPSTPY